MTLEQLVGYTIEELESLSDSELEDKLRPFFTVTRPDSSMVKAQKIELASKAIRVGKKYNSNHLIEQAQRELEKLGFKI